jgi:uroporphyrin-III C-methyltransferase
MGVGALEEISRELVERGRPAGTPVAVIHAGATPRQKVVVSTLSGIAPAAADAGIRSPAIIVIGEVVSLHDQIGGYRIPD